MRNQVIEQYTNLVIDIQSRVPPKNHKDGKGTGSDIIEISINGEETEGGYGYGGSITDYTRGANNA